MIEITKNELERAKVEKGKTKLLIYDTIFKAVFIKEQNVLLRMIKDIFDVEDSDNPITILGYETVGNTKTSKTYRGDVLVRLSDKTHVLIEMNYRKDKEAIERNMVNLVRIHNQVLKSGTSDYELKSYRMRGINFNNFPNESKRAIETYAFCNIDTGKVVSLIYSFCNIALEKCRELVYDIDIKNLPKKVRWRGFC